MKYREFGKTGIQVSALGFGAMRLPVVAVDPQDPKSEKVVDEKEAVAIIRRAIRKGVNYVDTAYGYHGGHSERIVGLALQDGWREKTYLATKFPCWQWKKSGDFGRILNTQLKRLQTDHIDFYMFHAVGAQSWNDVILKQGLLEKMLKARKAGKIRHIGFSFHDSLEVFKSIVDYTDIWDFCQIQINYLDTEHQAGLAGLRYAHAKGLAVIAMEPLKGGTLANLPQEAAKVFEGTARSPVEWGLDFLWNMPEVSMLLSGMGTRQMVDDNVQYAGRSKPGMLAPADTAIIAQFQMEGQTGAFPESSVEEIRSLVEEAGTPSLETHLGGQVLQSAEVPFGAGEVFGIIAALIILAVVFRSLIPAFIPIVTAIVGVGVSMLALVALSAGVDIPSVTTALGAI